MEHIISALSVQKHNPQRVNVYLDGEFAFGLTRIVASWLQVGIALDEARILQLQTEDQYETAYQRSLRYLNYRPRTQTEIRQYLKTHETTEPVIDRVIVRLSELDLVNDARFAEAWVENRTEFRPRSRRALTSELRQHGVDAQLIEQSLESMDEDNLAYRAAQKQFRKYESLEWPDFRNKMLGFLARRGFNYEVSAPAVARVWAEQLNHEDTQE